MCSLAWADGGEVPVKKSQGRKLGLSIQVQGGGWGRAQGIHRDSAERRGRELLPVCRAGSPCPSSSPTPMARRWRSTAVGGGEFRIRLHARDENWHLYAYEFAHELCHVMSNHDAHPAGDPPRQDNQSFETLCETASLFTCVIAQRWKPSHPGPNGRAEADRLRRFFDLLVSEHRRLPPDAPLAAWLQAHEDELRHNPYLREKNEVLANLLLPSSSAIRKTWRALGHEPRPRRRPQQPAQLSLRWYANRCCG